MSDDNDKKLDAMTQNTMASVAEIMAQAMDDDDDADADDMDAIENIAAAAESDLEGVVADLNDAEIDLAEAEEELVDAVALDDADIECADIDNVDIDADAELAVSDAESDDLSDDESEEVNTPLDTIRILEALLFASPAPMSMNALRERLPENADVGGMLMQLKEEYANRGVHLLEMDGHWALRTADDLNDALLLKREVRRPLSRAAMETLAIVAYHQPVTRTEIENIRGVVIAKGTLDILMECGWVKPGRRRETPGRPLTWITTSDFLDHFGSETVNDLPGIEDLKASGLLDRRPAIENIAPDLFDQMEEEDEKAERKMRDAEDEDDEGGFETHFNEADADEIVEDTAEDAAENVAEEIEDDETDLSAEDDYNDVEDEDAA